MIDCRPSAKQISGSIPKAKHLDSLSVFADHTHLDDKKIKTVFETAGIDINKPMIFFGGVNATVVRAVVEHVFDKSGKVFPLSFEAWDAWFK